MTVKRFNGHTSRSEDRCKTTVYCGDSSRYVDFRGPILEISLGEFGFPLLQL